VARKDEKAMLPLAEKQAVPCAANEACRYPGRLWIRTLAPDKRLCIDHYYRALEADHSLAFDETVPPRHRMLAKPVAGRD